MRAIHFYSFGRQRGGRERWSLTYGPRTAAAESLRVVQRQAAGYEVGRVTASVSEAGIGTGVSVLETGEHSLSIGKGNFISCWVCHLLLHPKPEKK